MFIKGALYINYFLLLIAGNYSCLQAVFELRRNIGYHLVQSYLPTSLIVVVSWVSFWLDVDAIPSRVTLGVTTLLTVCSESTSFRDKMPTGKQHLRSTRTVKINSRQEDV